MSTPTSVAYYHDIDLVKNSLLNAKIHPISTTERLALSLTESDSGFIVWDLTLNILFVWNGFGWVSGTTGLTFLSLPDAPDSYTGDGGKVLRVNPSENAIEFYQLTKADVGLGNVDNTSDLNKPISTATQTALNNKADKTTTITAVGDGITGGGSLAANRTISLDFSYLNSIYAPASSVLSISNNIDGYLLSASGTNVLNGKPHLRAITNGLQVVASGSNGAHVVLDSTATGGKEWYIASVGTSNVDPGSLMFNNETDGLSPISLNNDTLKLKVDTGIKWTTISSVDSVSYTAGIAVDAANRLQINDGYGGYGDLKLRNLFLSTLSNDDLLTQVLVRDAATGQVKYRLASSLVPSEVPWANVTGAPTSLSGYGITDAYTQSQINNFFAGTTPITGYNPSNWNTAYGWGDHASAGYLTSFTETDPTVAAHIKAITNTQVTNWDAAYSWGNHASAGYLTSFTETDPTVPSHVKAITTTKISNWDTAFSWGNHASAGYESTANKGVAGGYASLDGSGRIPSAQLPSYVDDVMEYANLTSFPGTGEAGKIYVAVDTNKVYRWTGSAYMEIVGSPGSTDAVPEGLTNLYFTTARARNSISVLGSLSYNPTTGVISYTQPTNVSVFTNDAGYITNSTSGLVNYYTKTEIQNYFSGASAITGYNKSNWDTVYSWYQGNPLSGYLPLSGGSMSGKIISPATGADVYGGSIELRERGYVLETQSDWSYAPGITLHWGNRYAIRFGADYLGNLAVDNVILATRPWVQSQGYLTGEVDTFQTVTARGNITNTTIRSSYNTASGRSNLSFNVGSSVLGNIHIENGAGPSNSANQAAITFMGGSTTQAQAGIYVLNDGSNGTSMGFATTDTYAVGPQLFMTASNSGVVNFVRSNPTVQGNTMLHAANYGSYAVPISGGVNMTGSFGLNDTKLYLRTNGDNNHYLWNAGDDWEELNAYEGTGFRITSNMGSNGLLYVYGTSNGGYTYSPYSFRAPIFYDSEDTAYYGNFAGTSVMKRVQFIHDWSGPNPTEGAWNIRGAYPSMTLRNTVSNNMWLWHMDGSGHMQYYAANGVDSNAWSVKHSMLIDGTFYSSSSMRSPIFYDSQDTSYFVDPNSTSVLSYARFEASESLGFYGARGRFTNEYMHLYRKVGIGNPTGWGTGEANTPDFGLSTYGGVNIAYGNSAGMSVSGPSLFYGHMVQSTNLAYPLARWGASSATGAVVIKLPGGIGNYGMVHMVIDIYEYNSNNVCTVIVGGHNWNGLWVNYGANVVGYTDKPIRLGFKDGQYCVVIGNGSSSWSYGQVILRKISNGEYYSGVMNLAGTYTAQIESDSYSWISGDLRGLRVPASLSVESAVYAPIYYDSNDGGYYLNPAGTSRLNAINYDNLYFAGDTTYGFIGRNVYADTINGRGSDALELNYYDGGPVKIGSGTYGSKALYAGSLYDDGSRVAISRGEGRQYVEYSRYVYNNGAYSGTGWTEPSDLGVRYANSANYANSSGSAGSLPTLYAGGVQSNPQTYFGQSVGVRVAMTGHWSVWSDTLWINGYAGGDVLQMCALHTLRNGTPRIAISAQASTSSSYGTIYELWSSYNMDAPNKSGTSYYQTNTWMQFNGSYGLYWPSVYGAHLSPNDLSSYTQFALRGSKNGYGGIYDQYSAVSGFMYDGAGNGGVYREANGRWYWYHHVGNNCTGISTSSTSSSYRAYIGGSLYAEGDVVAYSDARKKTDIVTIDNALEKVTNLRGVYYTRIDDPDRGRQTGVIAQEINEVLPEVVTYAADVDEYGVSYGNIVGVLIEAIKELTEKVKRLEQGS